MIYLNRNSAAWINTLTLASDADIVSSIYQVYATVTHEWGDTIIAESLATRVSSGVYTFTVAKNLLISAGVHKMHWRYVQGGNTFTQNDFINIYQPYISYNNFFDVHSELETDFGDSFDDLERKVKSIIDTHCGQKFEPYYNKLISMDGKETRQLYFNYKLNNLISLSSIDDTNPTSIQVEEYTQYIEISPESPRVVRWRNPGTTFSDDSWFKVVGDWGWEYVPQNITQAADLIIYDLMSDDSIYRQHAIKEYGIDRMQRTQFDVSYLAGSTGNIDADVLLMDYTIYTLQLI